MNKNLLTRYKLIIFAILLSIGNLIAQVTHTISVKSFEFSPKTLSINAGDSILFQWVDGIHTVTSDNSSWTEISMTSSHTSERLLFKNSGSFPFHCKFHGGANGSMNGTITVLGTTTGIPDAKDTKYEFTASPNPFEDELNLKIIPGNKVLKGVKIFDIIGKEVTNIDLSHKAGPSSYRVDFSQLKSGIYFCNIYTDDDLVESIRLVRIK